MVTIALVNAGDRNVLFVHGVLFEIIGVGEGGVFICGVFGGLTWAPFKKGEAAVFFKF